MDGKILPRRDVLATAPAHHGAIDYAEMARLGLDPDEILDFSSNINPFGLAPAVVEAINQVAFERYPDRDALRLRQTLAGSLSLPVEQVVVGNGTAELIWLIAFTFVRPGDRVLVLGPTFSEYKRCAHLVGGVVEAINGQAEEAFRASPLLVEQALRRMRPRLVFLCNPNNPTGSALDMETVQRWAATNPDTLFVVDEAYLPFVPGLPSALTLETDNIIALRSMTKDHALAGLRLGYAAGPQTLIEAIARVLPPWNVNAMAQAAGVAALQNPGHFQNSLIRLKADTEKLRSGLRELGLAPLPSATHFFIVDVGYGADFRRQLLSYGIQVRDCSSFGLPAYIRIATRLPEDNFRLLAAMATLLS